MTLKITVQDLKDCAEEARLLGVDPQVAAPPVYRALWSLGVPIRPPLYTKSVVPAIFEAIIIAIFCTLSMQIISRYNVDQNFVIFSLILGFSLIC